ncbi:DNA repair protein rev1 [Schizosaccharomyces pombe]
MAFNQRKRRRPVGIADFDEANDEAYESVGFHDYADYFSRKQRKLQNQNAALYKSIDEDSKSDLFHGLAIAINGYTKPSYTELRQMIVSNGGTFIQYVDGKTSISYLVCSFLTPSKARQWKHQKVVKPEWIVDCIEQKKILPWINYRTFQASSAQATLSFVASKPSQPEGNLEDIQTSSQEEEHDNEKDKTKESKAKGFLDDLSGLSASSLHNYQLLKNPNVRNSTTQNQDFLENFFSSSRLHHLSTWKADFKNEIQAMTTASEPVRPIMKDKSKKSRFLLHVDFDCFFASVSTRFSHELRLKPVAVAHGIKNSEIASCNYEARKFGIKNGMYVGTAKNLCPSLRVVDYDFGAYESVSREFYTILVNTLHDYIKVISIDEALLDITSSVSSFQDCFEIAESIRSQVREKTNCEVSVGIGPNVLLARLALRKAKPHNVYSLSIENAFDVLSPLSVQDLPGVGSSQAQKLFNLYGVRTIGQLQRIEKSNLQETFGVNYGLHLYNISRGIDTDIINNETPRRSISVDVNWGVRFVFQEDGIDFLKRLLHELLFRMDKCQVLLHQIQLRILKRADGAPFSPPKYLGAGEVTSFTKSSTFTSATNSFDLIWKKVTSMYKTINVDPGDVRGIGLQALKIIKDNSKIRKDYCSIQSITSRNKVSLKGASVDISSKDKEIISQKKQLSPKLIPSTPYDLPSSSQISSSALAQLPPSMQSDIQQQLRLQKRSITEYPSQLDPLFMAELPTPIRNEINDNHEIAMNKRLSLKSHADNKIDERGKKKIRQENAFDKLLQISKKSKTNNKPNVDYLTLKELPKDLQKQILKESNLQKSDLISEVKLEKPHIVTFQHVQSLEDLRGLLTKWYSKASKGPNIHDVNYFANYVCRVIRDEKNLGKAQMMLKWLYQLNRKECNKPWEKAIDKIIETVQGECLQRNIPPLMIF